jgi:hypothetical protein
MTAQPSRLSNVSGDRALASGSHPASGSSPPAPTSSRIGRCARARRGRGPRPPERRACRRLARTVVERVHRADDRVLHPPQDLVRMVEVITHTREVDQPRARRNAELFDRGQGLSRERVAGVFVHGSSPGSWDSPRGHRCDADLALRFGKRRSGRRHARLRERSRAHVSNSAALEVAASRRSAVTSTPPCASARTA